MQQHPQQTHAVHAALPALLDEQRPCTFAPNHEYNRAIAELVAGMSVRDKREIFAAMRQPNIAPDTFLPRHGISVAELTVMQVLSERPRPANGSAAASKSKSKKQKPRAALKKDEDDDDDDDDDDFGDSDEAE